MSHRKKLSLAAERERCEEARRARVWVEDQWVRGRGQIIGSGRALLGGPKGELFREYIECMVAAGPQPDIPVQGGSVKGYPLRWAAHCAHADLAGDPVQDALRQLALLYRLPTEIGGDITSPAWTFARAEAGLDAALQRAEQLRIGVGSCGARPSLMALDGAVYRPAGVAVVPSDRLIAVPSPTDQSTAAVVIELADDCCYVWDLSDPRAPSWSRWRSPEEWQAGRAAPTWEMRGPAYPWWWAGRPLMPVVISRWDAAPGELLTVATGRIQAALDIVLARTWTKIVAHVGSFQRAVVLSDSQASGLEHSMIDPTSIINIHGINLKMEIVPDSLPAAEALWSIVRARTAELAKRYDTGFEVRESKDAKSGTAIMLELTGLYMLRQQLATRQAPLDAALCRALAATHNYLVRAGHLSVRQTAGGIGWTPLVPASLAREYLIPEGEITISYPQQWNEQERRTIAAEMQQATDAGRESLRALWLLERGLTDDRPDGPNWAAADEAIRAALKDAVVYAQLGYGAGSALYAWQARAAKADATPADEATLYEVPADVATTASEGLRLRDETNRGPDGMSAQGRRLLKRARSLRAQTALLLGDLRELAGWLQAHANDAQQPADVGVWGDAADPSPAWVTWQTQGGDAALAWTRGALAQAATPAPSTASQEAQDAAPAPAAPVSPP